MSLLCLNYAKSPAVAAVLITIALSLSSFSQAGYLLNIQVSLTVQSLQYHKVAQPMLNYFPLQFNVFFGFFNQEIAPDCAGFLHGIANSAGTLAAIISTIGTGYFVQWLGSFQAFLTVTAGLYFVTTIFWNLYSTGERVL